jgi:hypothetical protein
VPKSSGSCQEREREGSAEPVSSAPESCRKCCGAVFHVLTSQDLWQSSGDQVLANRSADRPSISTVTRCSGDHRSTRQNAPEIAVAFAACLHRYASMRLKPLIYLRIKFHRG